MVDNLIVMGYRLGSFGIVGMDSRISNKMWMSKEWEESWYLNRKVGDAKDRIDVIHKVSYL